MPLSSTKLPGPGSVLGGKYVLRERLGEGGMGVVFLADQPVLARTVAIKILHPTLGVNAQLARNFCDEAVAAGRVRHPNSVSVYDVGRTVEGTPYIVMEHVRGRSLGRIIAEQEMALPRALEIVDQILAALEAAHAAGVVHADIKSDNFLVEELASCDRVVLIDFGLARIDPCERAPGTIAGTPEYLAPEVVLGECPTIASDLYAVGMILYELVTGTTPFAGGGASEILTRQVEDVVVPMSLRRADASVPPALDQIVLRALAKDPAARFESADEMRRALRAVVHPRVVPGYGGTERLATLPSGSPTRDCGVPRARSRLARGSDVDGLHLSELRRAVSRSITAGDVSAIAAGYLDLAAALTSDGHSSAAIRELEEGIDVLTAGRGQRAPDAPPEIDELVFALAELYERAGLRDRARRLVADAEQRRTIDVVRADT